MRRVVASLSMLTALSMLSACGATPVPPAKPPPVEPQTRLTPKKQERAPAIVAPPPAYGNKIVMAAHGSAAKL